MKFLVVFRDLDGGFAGHEEADTFEEARTAAKNAGGEVYLRMIDFEEYLVHEVATGLVEKLGALPHPNWTAKTLKEQP